MTEQLLAMMAASVGQFAAPAEWLRTADPDILAAGGTVAIYDQSWPAGFAMDGSFTQPAPLHLNSNVVEVATVGL